MNYSWPGNVRELRNVISYLMTMCEAGIAELADLPPNLRLIHPKEITNKAGFYEIVEEYECSVLKKSLIEHAENISKMALALNMDRSHLYSKLKQYGLYSSKRKT